LQKRSTGNLNKASLIKACLTPSMLRQPAIMVAASVVLGAAASASSVKVADNEDSADTNRDGKRLELAAFWLAGMV
jgi:hypothetical protein